MRKIKKKSIYVNEQQRNHFYMAEWEDEEKLDTYMCGNTLSQFDDFSLAKITKEF